MTLDDRRRAFAGWLDRHELTYAQGWALLCGLARSGIYLRVNEDGYAYLRLMGGDAGQATIRGFMVMHGLGAVARDQER